MRILSTAVALALLAGTAVPSLAQTTTQQPAAPAAPATPPPAAPSAPAPATGATTGTTTHTTHHARRQTLKARFDAANTTHDGHLTKDQADAARWTYVSSHFDAIDADRKGYVTISDIRAFSGKSRAHRARHSTAPAASGASTGTTTGGATTAPAAPAAPAAPSGSSNNE